MPWGPGFHFYPSYQLRCHRKRTGTQGQKWKPFPCVLPAPPSLVLQAFSEAMNLVCFSISKTSSPSNFLPIISYQQIEQFIIPCQPSTPQPYVAKDRHDEAGSLCVVAVSTRPFPGLDILWPTLFSPRWNGAHASISARMVIKMIKMRQGMCC